MSEAESPTSRLSPLSRLVNNWEQKSCMRSPASMKNTFLARLRIVSSSSSSMNMVTRLEQAEV